MSYQGVTSKYFLWCRDFYGNAYEPWYLKHLNTGRKDWYLQKHHLPSFHEILNPLHPRICPHCNGNHGGIRKDEDGYYCFYCGWHGYKEEIKMNLLSSQQQVGLDYSLSYDAFTSAIKWVEKREEYHKQYKKTDKQKEYMANYRLEHKRNKSNV